MKKTHRLALPLLCALLCLMLAACSAPAPTPAEETAAPGPTPSPAPTPRPTVTLLGRDYAPDARELDLRGAAEADVPALAEGLRKLTGPERLLLGSEAENPLSWESLKLLHDAAPAAVLDYGFTLFGRDCNLSDESLDLKYLRMDDEGALVGKAAACMTRLKTLDMDSCGVSNRAMAALRDSLPGTEVIWRVCFGKYYTARTDAEKILASLPGKGGELVRNNVMNLQYCTKLKYLDLGHNNHLETIEFCRSMPELEVLIVGMSFVEDFSPLASCPKLEYLEAMTSRLHDLTPLAELKNLRHLNICYNFAVTDISPLYGLTGLERLWIGKYCPVPPEQIARFRELVPGCVVNDTTEGPTEEGWRFAEHGDALGNPVYAERYALLRQQFGYQEEAYALCWLDPLYDYSCPYEWEHDEVEVFPDD